MSYKSFGVHACWLDHDCRAFGVPAFTYLNLWWVTIRINPPYDRWLKKVTGRGWDWHIVQVWRNRDRRR